MMRCKCGGKVNMASVWVRTDEGAKQWVPSATAPISVDEYRCECGKGGFIAYKRDKEIGRVEL